MAEGIADFDAALLAMVARVEAAAIQCAVDAAHVIEAAAKEKAPVETGTLRRSITSVPGAGAESLTGFGYSVGPTTVYSRRIELGFQGPDSLGRVYHQLGDPYMKPAVHESIPGITVLIHRRIAAAIRV